MPEWLVTVISLVGSTLITTIVGVVVKHTLAKEFKKQDELNTLRSESIKREREEVLKREISLGIEPISDKIDKISDKLDKVENGTLSSLRNDILTCYYRCKEKGYRNDYDYQNIHHLYEAYDELHGNSFIADIMSRFDNLPLKEDVKDIDVHIYTKKSNKKVLNETKQKENK